MAKAGTSLRGAIKPRVHSPLLKGKTRGQEVADLAELVGQPLMPWQRWVVDDYFSVDKDNKFRRRSGLLLVARQSGKSHLARMMCLAHLFLFDSKRVLIMSSNRAMALVSFREMEWIINHTPQLKEQVLQIRHANGTESIELKNGNRMDVVAATRDGSRGRTASFCWCDELREVSTEAYTALQPVTRATDGQTFYTSNAGDNFSEALNSLAERARSNPNPAFGFYEYSAPDYLKIDLNSKAFWDGVAQANPALGWNVSREAIMEAVSTSSVEAIRTEVLCQWIDSAKSCWPDGILEETSDSSLVVAPGAYTVFGFDVSPNRRNASLCAGQIMPDGRIAIWVIKTWSSQVAVNDLQIAVEIKAEADLWTPRAICYDKYATASIAERLSNSGCMTMDISGQQFYQACGDFLNALVTHHVVHNGQQEILNQMNNCTAKQSDSGWRIVKRKSAGDISAAISFAMIVSQLVKPQQTAQIIT